MSICDPITGLIKPLFVLPILLLLVFTQLIKANLREKLGDMSQCSGMQWHAVYSGVQWYAVYSDVQWHAVCSGGSGMQCAVAYIV